MEMRSRGWMWQRRNGAHTNGYAFVKKDKIKKGEMGDDGKTNSIGV